MSEGDLTGRPPASAYFDGAGTQEFYRPEPGVAGRPYVMVHRGDRARALVGADTVFEPDVTLIVGGNHRIDWIPTFAIREQLGLPHAYEENPSSRGDIVIGAGVRIGRGARILSGVAIGDGAVVRPFAVVVNDVAPYAIVEGSPAAQVGERQEGDDRVVPADAPPRRRVRDSKRLRAARQAVAWRLAGRRDDRIRYSDFPKEIPTPPPTLYEAGTRSKQPPILHVDPTSGHRLVVGNYSSVAIDAEFVLDGWTPTTAPDSVGTTVASAPMGGDIVVGDDVWVARGAKVLPGLTIGSGAVVAAYAVVTEDVRPYAVVVGNPAAEVSRRFGDDEVEALLRIAWWDWPEEAIVARVDDLCSADVGRFIERYGSAGPG